MAATAPARCLKAAPLRPRTPRLFRPSLFRPQALPPPGLGPGCVRHNSGPHGYSQAKALVFSKSGEPVDVLRLHNHSVSPELPDHAALVRTLAAPVNPADVNTIQGTYGTKPAYSTVLGTSEPSAVPGNEACLEVLAVGSAVTELAEGDWCIPASSGFGTWRTHARVDQASKALLRVDKEGLNAIQVATVSVNPCSAYRMLRDYVNLKGRLSPGSGAGAGAGADADAGAGAGAGAGDGAKAGAGDGAWFVQNGANSGVGRAAIQLGRLWGLRSINVIREREDGAETEQLRRQLLDLGATVVVTEAEFLDRSFAASLADDATNMGRHPISLGLNCVGGRSAAAMARFLSPGGTLVTYGAMSKQPVCLPTALQIFQDLRFRGFWLSRWANADPAGKKATVAEILGLIRDGKFADAPVQEVEWNWQTEEATLKDAVQGTLQGFRPGKGVFVFGDI